MLCLQRNLGGRILDLDPIGFCPLLGKYGPGVGTRNKNYTSYMYWFKTNFNNISVISWYLISRVEFEYASLQKIVSSTPCHGQE
jgi:hypothetical protein